MFPSPDVLNNFPYGRFVLANLAAKRAKMLKEGAISPVVDSESKHPLTIALIEIAREHVKPQFKSDLVAEERPELRLDDIDVAPELIPISEPTKGVVIEHVAPLLEFEELEEEEHEEDQPVPVTSLDDLDDEVEEDLPVAEDETASMSLTDFEEQENVAAEEEEED